MAAGGPPCATTPDRIAERFSRLEPLEPVRAGVLEVAYYEDGPAGGDPVLLLHGFPYDIHSHEGGRPDRRDIAKVIWIRNSRVALRRPALDRAAHAFPTPTTSTWSSELRALPGR